MLKIAFWRDAFERALRTFAQALAAVLAAGPTGLLHVPWWGALSAAGLAALLSLLTSVVASGSGDVGTAAFTSASRLRL
jgi:r1t holin